MSKAVLLFDVDGTLTEPRKAITLSMKDCLQEMRTHFDLGVVSGSDLSKIKEQLGNNLITNFDFVFAENGLDTYISGKQISSESIENYLGKDTINSFTKYCLNYISKLDIPTKTGNFVELRKGIINVSPVGRNCTYEQRNEFEKYDYINKVRERMIQEVQIKFADLNLVYSIGGQISFDVFPKGWDKRYCLSYLSNKIIYFFGDKTNKGGNDYEIYNDARVRGHAVNSYQDTIVLLKNLTIKQR